jgi:hypothetical protein
MRFLITKRCRWLRWDFLLECYDSRWHVIVADQSSYHFQLSLSPAPTNPTFLLSQGFPAGTRSASNLRLVWINCVAYGRYRNNGASGILVEIGYYSNNLNHARMQYDGNPAPPEHGNANATRLYKSPSIPGANPVSLAAMVREAKAGYSHYNALQAKAEKRYSNGLEFITASTYSKSIALVKTSPA